MPVVDIIVDVSKAKNSHKKLLGIGLEKIAEIENTSKNELSQAEKLQKNQDDLREIARLRGIKNRKINKKLIISLLQSEVSTLENNFNNNSTDDDDDDDTYDGKIRGNISDIRMMFSRLGDITTNKDRKKL